MSFTTGNDVNILQGTDTRIVGAGLGNDKYIISTAGFTTGQVITIDDALGANTLQLIGGVTIVSSIVSANAAQLTLSNGVVININGASTFSYEIGGNPLTATAGTVQTYTQFATTTLGAASVPTGTGTVNGTPNTTISGGTVTPTVPTFSVTAGAAAAEGTDATFTVNLSSAVATGATTVAYTLAGAGGASTTDDMTLTATTGTLTFAAGETSKTVTVPVKLDTLSPEAGEGVTLTLSTPSTGTAVATTPSATVSFTDVPLTYTLTQSATNVYEGNSIVYTLTASAPVAAATTVDFSIVAGDTAAANSGSSNTNLADFAQGAFNPTQVVMAAGATTATYTVTSANDSLVELPENYSVKAVVGTTTVATKTTSLLDGLVGTTYNLTVGGDSGSGFTGTGNDDTFNASIASSWSAGDALNGGLGNDTFNVSQTAAITNPVGISVTGIETGNFVSGTTGSDIDASGFTGMTALNFTGVTANTLKAAATTAVVATVTTATGAVAVNGGSTVSVTQTGSNAGSIAIGATTAAAGAVTVQSTTLATAGTTGGTIAVTGGTTININQDGANAVNTTVTDGAVTVTGNATTTAVTVSSDKAATAAAAVVGHVNGNVGVTDVNSASATAAGTITTVTLDSFDAATVNSGALNSLTLKGTGTSAAVTMGALTTPTVTTLGLNVNGLTTTGAVTTPTVTTLNINSSTAASTIASLVAAAATTINVSGDAALTLTGNTTGAVQTVTVTNTAGASFGTAFAAGVAFTGGAGADSVSLGATTKAITMGAGNDTVTSAGLVGTGGSVAAGDGTGDTIVMTSAEAAVADNDSTFNTKFTGFEVLSLSDALGAGTTLDLAGINNVSKVILALGGAHATTSVLSNLADKGTVEMTGANAANVTVNVTNALFNPADTLNLTLKNAAITAYGTVTAAGIETLNIALPDATATGGAAVIHTGTAITAAAATKIVLTGNNGLATAYTGSGAVTEFDASGVVANGTADTAANLAVTYVSVNTTAANAVTIKGGAGNDTLTGVGNVDTITGGEGADTITGAAGNDVIILTETTAAADTVVFATSAGSANGVDTITGFAAGTGADLAKLVAAATTNAAQASAGIADFEVTTNTTLTNGAAAFALTGANSTTGDIVEINATLSANGNLGAAGVTNGTELLKALSSTTTAASEITATTAADAFYIVAYQSGNAYLYQVIDDAGANVNVVAAEINLVGVFNGVAAGAFASGDFTV
jgi:S-layer protein